jgi:hypothetical protein
VGGVEALGQVGVEMRREGVSELLARVLLGVGIPDAVRTCRPTTMSVGSRTEMSFCSTSSSFFSVSSEENGTFSGVPSIRQMPTSMGVLTW